MKSIEDQVSSRLSSIRGRKSRQYTPPRLCHALLKFVVLTTLPLPQLHNKTISTKVRVKLSRRHPYVAVLGPPPLPQQSFQVSANQTQGSPSSTEGACRAKRFGPQTQLRRSSSYCPNQAREGKVRPNQNDPSSSNFFFYQVHRTFRTRFAKKSSPN